MTQPRCSSSERCMGGLEESETGAAMTEVAATRDRITVERPIRMVVSCCDF